MSIISIEGMEFYSHHGCFDEERIIGTKFNVDFYFKYDTSEAEKSDELEKTIDYQQVYSIIKGEMKIPSSLLEHVARRILDAVIEKFPAISWAEVKLSKLNPPLGGKIKNVSLRLQTDKSI